MRRYQVESYERAATSAQLACAEAEARAQRSEASLRYYRETNDASNREKLIAKLTKSISDCGEELFGAEGLVRTCASDPVISHPIAGLARRRELKKLQARVDHLSHRFKSEREMLKRMSDLHEKQTAIWLAAAEGDVEALERGLLSGGSANAADPHGFSAFLYGCSRGHLDVVRTCIEQGNADLSSEFGKHTPLVLAARHNHSEVLLELLRSGADADGVDSTGQTALHAVRTAAGFGEGRSKLLKISHGIFFPLHTAKAAEEGHAEIMQALVEEGGAHVDPIDAHGSTPLHLAIRNLRHSALHVLLDHGADALWKDLHGRSCLEVIPPLPAAPRGSLVPVSFEDAERLAMERQQRADIRRIVGEHSRRGVPPAPPDPTSAIGEEDRNGGGDLSSHLTLTKRVFPAANVHVDRGQQRALIRKSKGEGNLDRSGPSQSVA